MIGSFVGRRLNFLYVKDIVMRVWNLKNGFTMRSSRERMCSFDFAIIEDKQSVLDMCCFHITRNLFIYSASTAENEEEIYLVDDQEVSYGALG